MIAYLDTHTAIVGASGAGKTVTAKGHVEALLKAGRHVCVLDPTGAWWGLRSSADGEGPGFDIPIFGGSHGDVQIAAEQGSAIGKLIADGVSAIVDISCLRTGSEQRRFARDLCRALRAKPDGNFHMVVDEADEFAAQKPRDDYGFQVGEELIWMAKRGRLAGFVLTLITQRPASIDKEVLTQAQALIVHQLVSPIDQKPIVDYLKDHADKATLATIKGSLASLDRGERWIYAPRAGILERGVSPMPRTFDSSRTPGPGEASVEPKMLAQIDLGAIAAQLAPPSEDSGKAADVATDDNRLSEQLARALETLRDLTRANAECAMVITNLMEERDALRRAIGNFVADLGTIPSAMADQDPDAATGSADDQPRPPAARAKPPAASAPSDIPPRWQRILDGIAWATELLDQDAAERNIVAWLADISPKSSSYANDLGAMRTRGLIEYPSQGTLGLTEAGIAQAVWPETPPTKDALLEAISGRLEPRHRRILYSLWNERPDVMSRAYLAERAQMSATSSSFANDLGKLRTLGLIDYPQQGYVGLGRVLA